MGQNIVEVDPASNVFLNGQNVSVVPNPNGTVGSLSDRCFAGDIQACEQWRLQSQNAINQYNIYYPGAPYDGPLDSNQLGIFSR